MARPVIAGVDRWRGGWIIASAERTKGNGYPGGPSTTASRSAVCFAHAETVDEIHRTVGAAVVAIDMPMALPLEGRRDAEAALRPRLGRAASSVFTSPTRAALAAESQAEATAVNREHGGPGISAQAWGLAASIRELRNGLRTDERSRWFETHPESAFAVMAGEPLPSKRTGLGAGRRLALLRERFDIDEALNSAPERVPLDDLLDAVAALWSAGRIVQGDALIHGEPGPDDEGFERSIRI